LSVISANGTLLGLICHQIILTVVSIATIYVLYAPITKHLLSLFRVHDT